jgi:hypothetical protein
LPPTSGGGSPAQKPKKPKKPKKPTDPRVKQLIDGFYRRYETAMGHKYIVQGGKDGTAAKRLLKALDAEGVDPWPVLVDATAAMFADKFWRGKASIAVLAAQINAFRSVATPPASTYTPADAVKPTEAELAYQKEQAEKGEAQ